MNLRRTLFAVAGLAFAAMAQASPIVVRLEDLTPGSGNGGEVESLDPNFGDAGVVSLDWDPGNSLFTSLRKWHSTFWANLYPNTPASLYETYSGRGGAYCLSGATTICGLEMQVQSGYTVSLDSFFLGSFIAEPNVQSPPPFDPTAYTRAIAYSVIDLADNSVVAGGNPLVTILGLVINVGATSTAGFRINIGPDGFDGAINDITYRFDRDTTSVPEPGTLALLGFSLAGLAASRMRKHKH